MGSTYKVVCEACGKTLGKIWDDTEAQEIKALCEECIHKGYELKCQQTGDR